VLVPKGPGGRPRFRLRKDPRTESGPAMKIIRLTVQRRAFLLKARHLLSEAERLRRSRPEEAAALRQAAERLRSFALHRLSA